MTAMFSLSRIDFLSVSPGRVPEACGRRPPIFSSTVGDGRGEEVPATAIGPHRRPISSSRASLRKEWMESHRHSEDAAVAGVGAGTLGNGRGNFGARGRGRKQENLT